MTTQTVFGNARWLVSLVVILITSTTYTGTSNASGAGTISGELRRWHPIEIEFVGEFACEGWIGASDSETFNPFLHRRLIVTFTNGSRSYDVPGFFNATNNAAFTDEARPADECGNKWVVRFTPDRTGTWNYSLNYRIGDRVAVKPGLNAGTPGVLEGASGSFNVLPTNKSGNDFRGKGILRYVGQHYPRFDNGEYYIKTGADSPENFLGYDEFHNTFDHEVRNEFGPFVHSYDPHVSDYGLNPGPLWGANQDQGRGIYGALNYLSSEGVNSVYMINYGIDGGDGGDVWTWSCPNQISPNCLENKRTFDISKMDQWELVFRHMTELGIQIHFVFTETENDAFLDETQLALYYREMVARFSHHNALIWNLGEENKTSDAAKIEGASFIRQIDPYDHRITVHSTINDAFTYYDGLLGNANFEATSIQQSANDYNEIAIDLRQRSAQAGRRWIIYGDEQPNRIQQDLSNWDKLRRDALWGNLMGGGGGVQWYIAYQADNFGDVNLNNFRQLSEVYEDAAIAREFFENHVPRFWQLNPNNALFDSNNGKTYALAQPGQIYALYTESGNSVNELDLRGVSGTFTVGWYSPRTGRYEESNQQLIGGSWVQLPSPPFTESAEFNGDSATDYAAVVYADDSNANTPPLITDTFPNDNATDVGPGINLNLTLTKPVRAVENNISLLCQPGNNIINGQWGRSGLVYSFNPNQNLPRGAVCTMSIPVNSVVDRNGNPLIDDDGQNDGTYRFSFSVDALPRVTDTTPNNPQLNVDPSSNISMTFSESVRINRTGVTFLCQTGDNVRGPVTRSGNTFTLNPNTNLPANTGCELVIPVGNVRDNTGNTLVDSDGTNDSAYALRFRTGGTSGATMDVQAAEAPPAPDNVGVIEVEVPQIEMDSLETVEQIEMPEIEISPVDTDE